MQKNITKKELIKIESFLEEVRIIDSNHSIKKHAINIKKQSGLKLPDAIIAAPARSQQMPLLSADQVFEKVEDLEFFPYQF